MRTLVTERLRGADVPVVAALHGRAFPDFFLSSLGEPFLREFYTGFLGDPTAVAVVLREVDGARDGGVDGAIVGCAVGTTEPAGFFARLLRRRWVGFALASARAVLHQPSAFPRLVRAISYRGGDDSGSGALLSSIYVTPEARGGAGSLLLSAWEREVAELGAHSAHLTTDADGNDAVNHFYRRRGWHLAATFDTREGRHMNRYTKVLEGA